MREIGTLNKIWLNDDQRARLEAHGDLLLHEQIPASRDELLDRLATANIVLLSEVQLDRAALRAASQLELISLWSAGFDTVDIQAARDLDITVCNAPGCSATAIAEDTLAVAIYFSRETKLSGNGFAGLFVSTNDVMSRVDCRVDNQQTGK